ncbi:3-isopropylmalate dehydratase small subunit [Pseudorhodoplanes sp.]|uniref:3-isopropylmalate dehydratase small subunit n=1 Tax=Pseudorhodoplanes sp. TaxID=1934341 RepID=UPI003D13ACCA
MSGRAFVFGDDIDTDVLAPGRYMKGPIEGLAQHCLEAVDPDFARNVRPGDFVVAGRNFGMGSSREQAAQALKVLGVSAVVAKSFGGIFYRNALNLGLPVVVCAGSDAINPGDRLGIDLARGHVINETSGRTLQSEPLPAFLLEMLADGGLVAHLEKRFTRRA